MAAAKTACIALNSTDGFSASTGLDMFKCGTPACPEATVPQKYQVVPLGVSAKPSHRRGQLLVTRKVHGLRLLPSSWNRRARLFEDAGYVALSPGGLTIRFDPAIGMGGCANRKARPTP